MRLEDLSFEPVQNQALAEQAKLPQKGALLVKDAEVVEDDLIVCGACLVVGSKPLPSGICDICGAVWKGTEDDDDEDDFMTALGLLWQCEWQLNALLAKRKVVNKIGVAQETNLRDLCMNISDLLEGYNMGDYNE